MLRILLVLSVSLSAATVAHAEIKGCYERVYERKVLRKFPKQQITFLRFQYGLGSDGDSAGFDAIQAKFRGEKKNRTSYMECQPNKDRLSCGIEADGGLITVVETEKGIRIFNQFDLRFGDVDTGRVARPQDNHKLFTLFKVSDGRCK